jgi:hypothetical protein
MVSLWRELVVRCATPLLLPILVFHRDDVNTAAAA